LEEPKGSNIRSTINCKTVRSVVTMAHADYEPTEWCNVLLPSKRTRHPCQGHPTTALSICRHPAMYEPHECAGHRSFKMGEAKAWLHKAVSQVNAQRSMGYDPFAFVKRVPAALPANPRALPPIVPKSSKRKREQPAEVNENRPASPQVAPPPSAEKVALLFQQPPPPPPATGQPTQSTSLDLTSALSSPDVEMFVIRAPLQTVAANIALPIDAPPQSDPKLLYTNASQMGTGPAKPRHDYKKKSSNKAKSNDMDTN
jgi:hypothetical protein